MLSYEEFKERVMNEFLDYLPAKYKDCELKIHEVPKVNQVHQPFVLTLSGTAMLMR